VDSAGGFTSEQTVGGFTQGWTHIISAGNGPAGSERFLFYRASDGLAVTGLVDRLGGVHQPAERGPVHAGLDPHHIRR
jgi:hypothetical protein